MWLATQVRPWQSLGLIPADAGLAPSFMLDIAVHLARAGMSQLGAQVHVADATTISFENSLEFKRQVRETQADGPVIVAFAAPDANTMTVSLAQSTDALLLCVALGRSRSARAKEIVNKIGGRSFIGAVTFE